MISCTPRMKEKSNTDKILDEFKKGYESYGNTTETLYLYKRNEWEIIRKKFYENDNILFALPLYVECIPGIMAEFLESLKPKQKNNTKIGFLLKGDMFAVSFMDGKTRKQMVEPFYNMGKYYAGNNYFHKEMVNDFAKKLGCKGSLNAKPYQNYVQKY